MPRPPLPFLVLRGALLLIALASAVGLGAWQSAACEMHGLGAARGLATTPGATAHHAHGGASDATHGSGHHSSGRGGSGCDCTCIGACTMAAPVATAPTAVTVRVGLAAPQPRVPLDREPARTPPVAPDRLLPFGNGPPPSPLV